VDRCADGHTQLTNHVRARRLLTYSISARLTEHQAHRRTHAADQLAVHCCYWHVVDWATVCCVNCCVVHKEKDTETNRIQLVLSGVQNRTTGPYLATINKILIHLGKGR
jgi:hypothetical protein